MSFLKKISDKSNTPSFTAGEEKYSLRDIMLHSNIPMSPKRCDLCGVTFPCPEQLFELVTIQLDNWILDIGGFCPRCRKYLCPKHAKFVNVGNPSDMTWLASCNRCESALQPGPETSEIIVANLTGIDFAHIRKQQNISFSTIVHQMDLAVTRKRCDMCGDTFQLPVKYIWFASDNFNVKRNDVKANSFALDLGGYCRNCGQYLCPKHIEVGEAVKDKKTYWAPCCTTCHSPLYPTSRFRR